MGSYGVCRARSTKSNLFLLLTIADADCKGMSACSGGPFPTHAIETGKASIFRVYASQQTSLPANSEVTEEGEFSLTMPDQQCLSCRLGFFPVVCLSPFLSPFFSGIRAETAHASSIFFPVKVVSLPFHLSFSLKQSTCCC